MDCYNRFDLIFEDDAEEYLEQKEKELKKRKKAAAKERKRIEEKGECQGCDKIGYNRWTHNNECYLCWDCFIHDLQEQSSIGVSSGRVTDREEYIDRYDWQERWENNE